MATCRILLKNGYPIKKDPPAWERVILFTERQWRKLDLSVGDPWQAGLVELFLNNGQDPLASMTEDAVHLLTSHSKGFSKPEVGCKALHIASFLGLSAVVEVLLHHGVDPNLPDAQGRTPLDYIVIGFENKFKTRADGFYGAAGLLATRGGCTHTTSEQQWKQFISTVGGELLRHAIEASWRDPRDQGGKLPRLFRRIQDRFS